MSKQYLDIRGNRVVLGSRLGNGGEGAVFEINGRPKWVAKVYHEPVSQEKAIKLANMAQSVANDLTRIAAWPCSTLHESAGRKTVGIIMPRIGNAREIHELYSPAHRKTHFPKADWKFLIRTARNCAAAFESLHRHNIVIGDVNQGNIFVTQRAVVSLIDCDSFQFSANGRTHVCEVGVAHFTPPELQSVNFRDVVRTKNHDHFGLAVLIFHLLFMGRHPFSGRFLGSGEMPIEKAIRERLFAYGSAGNSQKMQPPPNTLALQDVTRDVARLFERAFISDQRGSAREWVNALTILEKSVQRCKEDPGHYYLKQRSSCPWCRVITSGGPNFFVSVSFEELVRRGGRINVAAIWAEIERIGSPTQVIRHPPSEPIGHLKPKALPTEVNGQNAMVNVIGAIVGASGGLSLIAFEYHTLALFTFPLLVVFGVWWIVLLLKSPMRRIRSERRARVREAEEELRRAQSSYENAANRQDDKFYKKLEYLTQLKTELDVLESSRNAELGRLQQNVRQRQMDEYLQRCFISDANIPGVGPTRISALESYGIETAYDISWHTVIDVPGFGEVFTKRLVEWQSLKKQSFRFNPSKGVPKDDLRAVEMKYHQKRLQCERQIQRGPSELRAIVTTAKSEAERLYRLVADLELQVAQAQIDLQAADRG